uniref:DNA-binding protein HEXBP-like n=1 Tax=Nicotiana tabacum TaxID=4097 RepID=A0A1S4DJ52_TOBAC|nr:PREDICTED: DNA-binding protein HEXBP-like [Nicotiana tabacum]
MSRSNVGRAPQGRGMLILRSQVAHLAQPLSSSPPTRGAFGDHSSRPNQSQFQQPRPPRACYECGATRHMMRDCSRVRMGAPPQTTQAPQIPHSPQGLQAIIATPVAAPPALLYWGGGKAGRDCPRGSPPTRGAFGDHSSRPSHSQFQQPRPPRACYECGATRHIMRDCPRVRTGAPPQTTQAPWIPHSPQGYRP